MKHDETRDKVVQKELQRARAPFNKFDEMIKALWDKANKNEKSAEELVAQTADILIQSRARKNTCVLSGDSITAICAPDVSIEGVARFYDTGWWLFANALLGQRFDVLNYAGVGGDTSAQLLTRFETDVIAYKPSYNFIEIGVNDIGEGVPYSEIWSNILAMIDLDIANNITPIVSTITPTASMTTSDRIESYYQLNKLIRDSEELIDGLIVLDMGTAYLDPSIEQPTPIANAVYDGTHPSAYGAILKGKRCYEKLDAIIPKREIFSNTNYDPNVINTNAMQLGVTGGLSGSATGVVADDYNLYSSTAVVASKETRSDSVQGEFSKITTTTGNYIMRQLNIDGTTYEGKEIFLQVELESEDDWSNVRDLAVALIVYNVSNESIFDSRIAHAGGIDWNYRPDKLVLRTPSFIVPIGADDIDININFDGSSSNGTLKIGRCEIVIVK